MAVNINGDTGIDKVQPGSVDGVDLTDGSVTENKIGTGAVTSTKLANDISVPGTVTATSFVGSGASLTGIAGGFSNMEVFTSPGTWTNPGSVTKVKVTVVGGGGGGGGGYTPNLNSETYGSGGGGGGTAIEIIPFPSATNVPITIGAGGTAPANGYTAPTIANSGGTSSFGAYCSATGGGGGEGWYMVAPGPGVGLFYAFGGSGSGGQINIRGGNSDLALNTSPINSTRFATSGGNSYLGGGGRGAFAYGNGGSNGEAGTLGGGGGGAVKYPPYPGNVNGGTGGDGIVIVEY